MERRKVIQKWGIEYFEDNIKVEELWFPCSITEDEARELLANLETTANKLGIVSFKNLDKWKTATDHSTMPKVDIFKLVSLKDTSFGGC